MSRILLVLTSAGLLGLSACADLDANKTSSAGSARPTESAKSVISAEASAALAAAQAAVKDAKSKDALWTTAESALKAAEGAAAKGDSDTVIKQAKRASSDVQKGLAQLNYPMLKVGD